MTPGPGRFLMAAQRRGIMPIIRRMTYVSTKVESMDKAGSGGLNSNYLEGHGTERQGQGPSRSINQKENPMFDNTVKTDDFDQAFAAFDIQDLEVLEVAQGVALPEMGASNGSIGTSSSSSTCSSSTC